MTVRYDQQSKKLELYYLANDRVRVSIIDPRDTRKVIGVVLDTCHESRNRKLKPNSFGIGRM